VAVAAVVPDQEEAKGRFRTTVAMGALDAVLLSPAPQLHMRVAVVVDVNRRAPQEQASMEPEPVEPLLAQMQKLTEAVAVAAHHKAVPMAIVAAMAHLESLSFAMRIHCQPQPARLAALLSLQQADTEFTAGTGAEALLSNGTLR
jgi:hypothetical protein